MMNFKKEQAILDEYVRAKKLKFSAQRVLILNTFLNSERHLSADELYELVKKASAGIGCATIYRSLKLFCGCGLCRELKCEDGLTRYEHLWGHKHHDHLICLKCGRFVEVASPRIERIQEELARKEGFVMVRHRLELYGLCPQCRKE